HTLCRPFEDGLVLRARFASGAGQSIINGSIKLTFYVFSAITTSGAERSLSARGTRHQSLICLPESREADSGFSMPRPWQYSESRCSPPGKLVCDDQHRPVTARTSIPFQTTG